MKKSSVGAGVKFISLLLIVGGIVGIAAGLLGDLQTLRQTGFRPSPRLIFTALFILVFGWSVWVGVMLWRGQLGGYRWAKVLFAAQAPILTVPGFSFFFHTGLALNLFLEGPHLRLEFELASTLHLLLYREIDNVAVGVNLVAILVLIHLFRVTSPNYGRKRDTFGLIGDP